MGKRALPVGALCTCLSKLSRVDFVSVRQHYVLRMDQGPKLHLKEWLVVQIESGQYEGLSWEDEDKTMFRIPWKHAAKKDYKQTADAAIFKVSDHF